MKLKIKNKINIVSILSFITSLFLVLNCQSVFQNSKNINFHIYELCFVFIVLESIYVVYKFGITKKNTRIFIALSLVYIALLIIYIVFSVKGEDLFRFLSRFLIFPFSLLFFMSKCPRRLKVKIFEYFIFWAVIISIITSSLWFLSSFAGLKPTSEFVWNWSGDVCGYSFFNLYFSSPYQYIDLIPGLAMRRNIGIFTEGPMFMIVLSLSLLFAYTFQEDFQTKKWEIVAILIAMITTFSVTGYIVVIILSASVLIKQHKKYQNRIILCCVLGCIGIVVMSGILEMKSSSASYLVRMDDFSTGIKAFLSSPIVGIGYENTNVLMSYMSNYRSFNMGFSNTLFSVLAYGGILLASIYVFPIIQSVYISFKRHNYTIFIFCVVYFLLYASVIFYTFFINFIIWGYLLYENNYNEKR